MKKLFKVMLVSVFTLLVAAGSAPSIACGPTFPAPVFSFAIRPENFGDFAQGKIGIISPSWHRSMLFAAYRTLNGLPFSQQEQQDLIRNWQAEYERIEPHETAKNAAIDAWIAARNKALSGEAVPKIYASRTAEGSYDSYLNCTTGAFENATKTLAARIKEYSLNDDVKDWVRAQDQVFANCSDGATIPQEASADKPEWLKNDRDYQIAAAHFYAMHYQDAKDRFTKITQNSKSGWRQLAAYVLARVAVREASTFAGDDAAKSRALYEAALQKINEILADTTLSDYQPQALQLQNYVNFRLHPDVLHEALAKKLLTKQENTQFFQDLTDYRRLLDKTEELPAEEAKTLKSRMSTASELTDWILTLQASEPEGFTHAYERWQSTKNPAWLVASLIKAPADSAEATALIAASLELKKDSPAFLTANYHAVRLQMAKGQVDDARKTLDAVLAAKDALTISASNQFYAQRMLLAQNIDEFIEFAQRKAAVFSWGGSEYELMDVTKPAGEDQDSVGNEREWLQRSQFDTDAARTLNLRTPMTLLKKMALHPKLPDYLKRRLVMSVWVRAVLLNDDKTAQEFAPYMAKFLPESKEFMKLYRMAKNAEVRHFEAIWMMLKNPGFRPLVEQDQGRLSAFNEIDNYRDNWWCDADFDTKFTNKWGDEQPDFPAPTFLSQSQISDAATENAKIAALTGGSNYLAMQAAFWAQQSPNEKRLPEALALGVKATRYGCQNCSTAKASKVAYDVLAKRFKNTEWKKKTPYWFGADSCEKTE